MIVECPQCQGRYDVSGRAAGTRVRCRCNSVFIVPRAPRAAGSLRCPECGAAVSVQGRRCDHCEADLLVRACPRCFQRVFHGNQHCTHCGVRVEMPAAADPAGDARQRLCPRCRHSKAVPLEGRLVDGFLLDECPRCSGVYVDVDNLERIIDERRQLSATELLGYTQSTPAGPATLRPANQGPMYLKCPDCDTLMNRRNFGQVSGVIVDLCPYHGTWFDADELPRVVAFVSDGGLERGQRFKTEEHARLTRMQADAASATGAGLPNDSGWGMLVEPPQSATPLGGLISALGRLLKG